MTLGHAAAALGWLDVQPTLAVHPLPSCTGLVITPFLPGDSLLFATGALAALGKLSLPLLLGTYVVAATLGDAVNYASE